MRTLLLIIFLAGGTYAQAQNADDSAKGIAGSWEMSNSDRDRLCALELQTEAVKGGLKVQFDKACINTFPLTKDVQAWTLNNDVVRFIDGRGRTVLELSEVETGMFEGERLGEGLIFLQNAAAAQPAFRDPDQMFGSWRLSRDASALCNLSLTGRSAGQNGYVLQIEQPCDDSVARFNPTLWRMDMGELVITFSNGSVWRFAEGEGGNWRRVPESAEALQLARK